MMIVASTDKMATQKNIEVHDHNQRIFTHTISILYPTTTTYSGICYQRQNVYNCYDNKSRGKTT